MKKELHIQVEKREIDLNGDCDNTCQDFLEEFKKREGTIGNRGTKSLYMTPYEKNLITLFCSENDINLPDLIRYIYFIDYAMSDSLILALYKSTKPNLNFLKIDHTKFSYDYLKDYEYMDKQQIRSVFEQKGSYKPIRDRSIVLEEVEKHYERKGFSTWSKYVKIGLIDLKIYPYKAAEIAMEHFRENNVELTEAQKREKKRRQEINAAKKTRIPASKEKKDPSVKLLITSNAFEEEKILQPFKDALKASGLTFGGFIKYHMLKDGIIEKSMIKMKEDEKKKYEEFSYSPPNFDFTKDEYERYKVVAAGKPKKINNVSVLQKTKEAVFEKLGKGNFNTWAKNNILKKYNVYPKFLEEI